MALVILPSQHAQLSSTKNAHVQTIYDGKAGSRHTVPVNHDVAHISLSAIPHGLEKVCIEIGGQRVIEVGAADLAPGVSILSAPLPLSHAYFMNTQIRLCFEQEYLREHERRVWEWVDETREQEGLSDTEIEIFDGRGEYHTGFRVVRKRVPTGNRVQKVAGCVAVEIPEIHLGTTESTHERNKPLHVDVWQKTQVFPQRDACMIRKLAQDHELTPCDGSTIEDVIRAGEPAWCKVKNCIRFQDGMAGLVHNVA